ncbi:hypothetical protein Gbem_4072 [Citrifermentans bemidjiense Bem]|uniref:Uncharacterized protein n=1 Tax=Citrifermentans bemidjiense (strain ATCC BAA-1014 / DSM 16622 / JCM 12645 / Bem) TaxID=404380 RepID=E1P675_CITBB|nr:hypothetical protein Gbem_4072 [Citrifermentans bemidjiense Bem]
MIIRAADGDQMLRPRPCRKLVGVADGNAAILLPIPGIIDRPGDWTQGSTWPFVPQRHEWGC